MTKEEFAMLLHGGEMGSEISDAEEKIAKESGLFVIFGYSDDNVEIRGVESEERGAYNGTDFWLMPSGLVKDWHDVDYGDIKEARDFFLHHYGKGKKIEAVWDDEDQPAWTYKTEVPHATFDIMEDGECWCRGIVIDSRDLA